VGVVGQVGEKKPLDCLLKLNFYGSLKIFP